MRNTSRKKFRFAWGSKENMKGVVYYIRKILQSPFVHHKSRVLLYNGIRNATSMCSKKNDVCASQ